MAAIHKNLTEAVGSAVPEANLPSRLLLLPWQPMVKAVDEAADLSSALAAAMEASCGVPEEVEWAGEWRRALADLHALKVYRVAGAWVELHVVAAFAAPLVFRREDEPQVGVPDAATLEIVRRTYQTWREAERARPAFVFYACGAPVAWESGAGGLASGEHYVVCSSPDGADRWETRMPPVFGNALSLRDFIDRLKPETREQRIARIKTHVDELLDTGYQGYVHAEKIANETGCRQVAVQEAMVALTESGLYALYKTKDGRLAVRKASGKERARVTAAGLRRGPLRRHAWRIAAATIGVGAWFLRDVVTGKGFDPLGFLVLVPLVYIGSCIQGGINRRIGDLED